MELRQKTWETLRTLDSSLLDFRGKYDESYRLTKNDYWQLIKEIPDNEFKEKFVLPAFLDFLNRNPELRRSIDETHIQKHIRLTKEGQKIVQETFHPERRRWWKIW